VAGNIKHREAYRLAERYFSHLNAGVAADPGLPPGVHACSLIRHKAHLEQTHICLGTVSPSMISEERYCAHLLSNILGGGMSSRLFQNIRERRGLVYSIYSMLNLHRDAGALVVYAAAAPDKASEVVNLILKEFRILRENLVSPKELKRAKEYVKGSILLSLESSGSRMTHLAQQLIYYGRFSSLEEILDAVERVSARDIRHLANRIFDNATLALTALSSRSGRDLEEVAIHV